VWNAAGRNRDVVIAGVAWTVSLKYGKQENVYEEAAERALFRGERGDFTL
jgi:hypothetical protein